VTFFLLFLLRKGSSVLFRVDTHNCCWLTDHRMLWKAYRAGNIILISMQCFYVLILVEEAWSLGQKLLFSFASPEVILAGTLGVKTKRIRFGSGKGYEGVVIKYISARVWGINTDGFQLEKRRIQHKDILRGKYTPIG
jgi:hypothetical protein